MSGRPVHVAKWVLAASVSYAKTSHLSPLWQQRHRHLVSEHKPSHPPLTHPTPFTTSEDGIGRIGKRRALVKEEMYVTWNGTVLLCLFGFSKKTQNLNNIHSLPCIPTFLFLSFSFFLSLVCVCHVNDTWSFWLNGCNDVCRRVGETKTSSSLSVLFICYGYGKGVEVSKMVPLSNVSSSSFCFPPACFADKTVGQNETGSFGLQRGVAHRDGIHIYLAASY